jgi:cobalt-zinc-cadmium efflux system outer membrane protein
MLMIKYFSYIKIGVIALYFYSAITPCAGQETKIVTSCEPKILDFDTAVQRTLDQSLILNQAQHEIEGRKGLITQARLYPNPEFVYDVETSEKGWKNRQDIYALNQRVELGGKRQKQIKIATYEYYAALTGYEISKLERLNRLSKAFIRVVAAQELSQLAMNHQVNAQEALRLINAKVEAGKASFIQQNKAQVAQSLADLNFKRAVAEFKAAKNQLALLWASACPDFDAVTYPFFDIAPPIPLEDYLSKLCNQPEVVQSLYQYMAAYHNVRLEKAARIPDVNLTLGYSYDQGDKGVVAGIAVPLPIWDRNQGNIQKAYSDMLKTSTAGKQLLLFLETKLSNTYLELMRAYQEAEDLKNLVLISSSQALALAQEGYREGKLEYWEVLDAQRFFFEAREKYIYALVQYHHKRAEIDYLTSQTE